MDLSWERVQVVLGVEVKVDAVVSQCFHVGLAAGNNVTLRVRGAHVGGVLADDVGDSALVLDHLLFTHIGCDIGETVVGPSVGGDLVTLGNHTLDDGRIRSCRVNRTFAEIVARHEESGVEAELLQYVQQLVCVKVWSVVVR